jgi:hypothetical protein
MDKHYYLIAQLPALSFGKEPLLGIDRFLFEAKKWLSAGDLKLLSTIDLGSVTINKGDPRDLKAFKKFELALRNDIAAYREAQHKETEFKPSTFPVSAIKEGNPLEVELRFMEMRWQFLDEMEKEHYFDFTILISYFIKLLILKRYFSFDKEMGLKKFQMLYHEVTA